MRTDAQEKMNGPNTTQTKLLLQHLIPSRRRPPEGPQYRYYLTTREES